MPEVTSKAQARYLFYLASKGKANKKRIEADINAKGGLKNLPEKIGGTSAKRRMFRKVFK